MVASTPAATSEREDIAVCDPASGRSIGAVPRCDAAEVEAVVRTARAAQPAWAALSTRERSRALRSGRRSFVAARREIVDLLAGETGKTTTDCVGEAIAVCLDIGAGCRYAPRALRTRRIGRRLPIGKRRYVRQVPFGVVGVIGPWNAPLTLTLGDAIYALAAGNTAVVKPSELTPLAVRRAVEALAVALPAGVLQVVTGDGATGAALVDCVDMICLTGSPATGRAVMERAARRLVPVLLELGGKDPMIVLDDANLERAANAAVWGGFFMTGQVCMSIERIYVSRAVADSFTQKVVEKTRALRLGRSDADVDLGPLTSPRQVELLERQIAEAVAAGAQVLVGGGRRVDLGPQFFAPTILAGVPADTDLMRRESFGPVMTITPVESVDEAIALANDNELGLNASVWTADTRRGLEIAARLETGSACVNDCILNAGDAELPFGGAKQSGVGWRHGGVEGVRRFTRPQALRLDSGRRARDIPWFPYSRRMASFALNAMGWIWR